MPEFGPAANALLDRLATSFGVEEAQEVRQAAAPDYAWLHVQAYVDAEMFKGLLAPQRTPHSCGHSRPTPRPAPSPACCR